MKTDVTALFRGNKRVPLFLTLVFLVSVLVRLPYLGRPMSSHHEWLTSTSLIHIQSFYEQGFIKTYFSPCMSYANAADKNIDFHPNLKDASGNMFYLSFPPFAFLFPAFVFKAVHVYPAPLGLQIFNLFFHFTGCFFIYLILLLITGRSRDKGKGPNLPAILGFLVYCFSPAPLWFQSNVYMSDMFVQVFFIVGIWLYLKLDAAEGKQKRLFLLLFGMDLFLFVYTEWMGVFFAATVFILTLFKIRKKGSIPLLAMTALGVIAPLALTLWQYSLISGFPAVIEYMQKKFLYRTGDPRYAFGAVSFLTPTAWLNILVNYIGGFFPFLALVIYLAYKNGKAGKKSGEKWSPGQRTAVVLSLAPALAHNFVFFNFTSIHDFSALKGGVFIAILAGLLYHKFLERTAPARQNKKRTAAFIASLFFVALLMYYVINGYGAHDRFKKIGEAVRFAAHPDEVVFIQGIPLPPEPQILVYARRSIAPWQGRDKALELMKLNGVGKGALFTVSADHNGIASVERFEYTNK